MFKLWCQSPMFTNMLELVYKAVWFISIDFIDKRKYRQRESISFFIILYWSSRQKFDNCTVAIYCDVTALLLWPNVMW